MAETIRIACTGSDMLPLDQIEDFQSGLKRRGKKEVEQIITSILKFGFSFPFYVWNGTGHNYCLDGHGRLAALAELRRRGTSLPTFPVVYVDAADEAEAKQKLLRLNSQYGTMSIDSVLEFMDGLEIEGEELALPSGTLELDSSEMNTVASAGADEVGYHEKIEIIISASGDEEAEALYGEFVERGLKCRISTL